MDDNYEYALETLEHVWKILCGGYYEPKSERDRQLAVKLLEIIQEKA